MTHVYSRYRYLIIGGTTKAATTSLFSWFSAHPKIRAASFKETRFFLDLSYPLPSKYRFETQEDRYEEFFKCKDPSYIRMEATPDYLYSPGTPLRIFTHLPLARVVFILRQPTSRLISWYNFAKQLGQVSPHMSFEDYIKVQRQGGGEQRFVPQHLRALEQGRYSIYVERYLDTLGKERVCVLWYEKLLDDPLGLIQKLCNFSEISPPTDEDFRIKTANRTLAMKHSRIHRLYIDAIRNIRYRISEKDHIRRFLQSLRSRIEPYYLKLNASAPPLPLKISEAVQSFLDEYYCEEASRLEVLVGERPPW